MMKRLVILFALALSAFAQGETVTTTVYTVYGVISASALAQGMITAVDAAVQKQNSNAADVFNAGCKDWTVNALHTRDLGLPLAMKPVAPPVVHVTAKLSGATNPIVVTMTTTAGPDVLGACPDLPTLPAPKSNVFVLGAALSNPGWFSVGPGDTMPANSISIAPDGSRYFKYAIPFGAYYIKVQ